MSPSFCSIYPYVSFMGDTFRNLEGITKQTKEAYLQKTYHPPLLDVNNAVDVLTNLLA